MKLSLSNLAWNPADEDAAIALMQKYGFTGVERAATKPFKGKLRTVAIQSLFYGHPELQICRDTLECFDVIAKVYLEHWRYPLILGAPKNRVESSFIDAVNIFRACVKADMRIYLEPNPPQYGCNFITNTKEAQELVAAVNHPNFRLHLDSGIMTLNGETDIPADIAHFHISQPYLAPVGPGTVDHLAMAKALRAIDYRGWCSVEMLPCENLEKSLEFVAGIYGD